MGKVSGKGLEKEAKRLVSWFAVRLKFHATACRRLANLSVRSSSDATNEKTQCRVETGSHLSLFQGKPGAQASHRPHPCSHPCSDPASEGQNLAQVLSHLLQGRAARAGIESEVPIGHLNFLCMCHNSL
jgi:hypothetical protein